MDKNFQIADDVLMVCPVKDSMQLRICRRVGLIDLFRMDTKR